MNDSQKAELARVSSVLRSWGQTLRARSDQAVTVGYGVTDSYSDRVATELQGLADALDGLSNLV